MNIKKDLRRKILKARKEFDEFKFFAANEKITNSIKEIFVSIDFEHRKNSNKPIVLGLYWPIIGEPDLLKLAILDKKDAIIGLPKMHESKMKYGYYGFGTELERSGFGEIMQPKSDVEIVPHVIIAAGLAYSVGGYRLGFGGGHYDRYLSDIKKSQNIITIGVCFDDYLFEHLPTEEHDIRFDYVITEQTIIKI